MQALLLAGILSWLAPAAPPAEQSIAGEWNAEINTPGGVREYKIVFRVDGEKLTGTVKRPAGDVPLTGTIKGDVVTFTYTVVYNDNPLDLTVTATVTGDTMKGIVDFGGAAQDDFAARRAPPPATKPPGQL